MRSFTGGNFKKYGRKLTNTGRLMNGKNSTRHRKKWMRCFTKSMNSRILGIMSNASGLEFIHVDIGKMEMG